ncbi:kinase-like domain-containing protein [Mycena olivaceomarginata]|nr:kinase-like domain-containing protein [Mycena olivaceomarginata]
MKLSPTVPPAALALAARRPDYGDELASTVRPLMYAEVSRDFSDNVINSGAKLLISYKRNEHVLDCAENLALRNDEDGLNLDTIKQILPQIKTTPGWKTTVKFETLPNGSFHLETQMELETHASELSERLAYPSVPFSGLRGIHWLAEGVYIVDTPLHGYKVLKTPKEPEAEPDFALAVKFLIALADVDFLIRPTQIVLDTSNVLRGFLMDYHPASSLQLVIRSLHRKGPKLSSAPEQETPAVTVRIPWSVKLAWTTDIAAAVVWLHSQGIYWGDLKLDNIVLCTDGHCRLIDYVPGAWTVAWCPPECARQEMHAPTADHDVFALGLLLWSLVEELPTLEECTRPTPGWGSNTCEWYGQLVDLCLRNQPQERPSAHYVYETLVAHGESEWYAP